MPAEFEFLKHLKGRFSLDKVGDDCAVVPFSDEFDGLVTADLLIEDIDFRLSWADAASLGHKVLAVSLSDIAAMGGTPAWAMLSIGVPASLWETAFLDEFYTGWMDLAGKHGVELVGGDLSRSPDRLVFDSIVFGKVQKGEAILRFTAAPGELICVSGKLGGAAAGLTILESSGTGSISDLIEKQLKPSPQIELGKQLQAHGLATSMIDISDGLSSDLLHLCEMSGVGAEIDREDLPIDPNVIAEFGTETALEFALNGGEDFGLLFTVRESDLERLNGLGVTKIGRITDEHSGITVRSADGARPLTARGFKHF